MLLRFCLTYYGPPAASQAEVLKVKLSNVKGSLEVSIRMGNWVIVSNVGEEDVTLKEGTYLFGFGAISWSKFKSDAPAADTEKSIPVTFRTSEAPVPNVKGG